jgi:two-component system, OmpR family, sensor histidine kinase VicK
MHTNHLPPYLSIFQQVLEKENQLFFIFNLKTGQVDYVNQAYERLMNRPASNVNEDLAQVIGQIHPDDRIYIEELYRKLMDGEVLSGRECRFFNSEGKVSWLCISAYLGTSEKGEALITGLIQEITARKENEFTSHKFANKKNSILEILSHDLAGPLNTLRGMAALIDKKTRQYGDPSLKEITELMQQVCERGVNLIRDFVTQEFLESSNVDMLKKRVDIVEKVKQAIDHYKAAGKDISKHFHLHTSSEIIYIELDELKFLQAINNLLSNAIKFTHDQGNIFVDIQEHPDHVLFRVADDGIGIPKELQKDLFEKFTKSRRPGVRGEKSTGLGMSIIKTIVKLHGGEIWFESAENAGSTFYIRLPKYADQPRVSIDAQVPQEEWRKKKEE